MTTYSIFLFSSFPTTIIIFLPTQHPLFSIYESHSILFSLSSLFSFFLPISLSPFSESLSLSLFFYFVFVHWLGTKSNTWLGFKRIKLEIFVSHNFSGSQLLYCKTFFPEIMTFPQEWRTGKQKCLLCLSKIYIWLKKAESDFVGFPILSYRWSVQTYNFCLWVKYSGTLFYRNFH